MTMFKLYFLSLLGSIIKKKIIQTEKCLLKKDWDSKLGTLEKDN